MTMRKFITSTLLTTTLLTFTYSQQPDDPFNWTEPIIIPSSIYVLWSGGDSYSSLQPNLNVYFSSTETHTIENLRSDSLDGTVGI